MTGWLDWMLAPVRGITGLPQFLVGLSLAARIAAIVGVFQVVVVLLALLVLLVSDERQVTQAWLIRLPAVLLLLALTPVVVYQAAKLWLERDASRFPDILEAWQAALVELKRQRIKLDEVPVFLVVGTQSPEEEERLLAASPCELQVQAAPAGAAALHVYGGLDAVFICLHSCSHASDAARRAPVAGGGAAQPVAHPVGSGPPAAADPYSTVFLGSADAAAGEAAVPEAQPRDVIDPSRTIDVSQLSGDAVGRPDPPSTAAAATVADRAEISHRLVYFCELLRRERGSLAPVNGVLAAVPWTVANRGPNDAQGLGRALGDDLQGIVKAIGLRSPVTVMVLGMEAVPGFDEFIRRMPAGERHNRLGQKFPIGVTASYDQLGSVASRACGHVEDVITSRILRSQSVLAESKNSALVEVVARLRTEFAGRLAVILRRAFSLADGEASDSLPFLAGCYLAACGREECGRGFVRGVLEKIVDSQSELEWTQRAELEDAAAGRAARGLWMVSGVVLAGIAIALAWRFVGSQAGIG